MSTEPPKYASRLQRRIRGRTSEQVPRMREQTRRRIGFGLAQGMIVAALVLAMTGGAFAAGHYLITSVKQISPRVLSLSMGSRVGAGSGARPAQRARTAPTARMAPTARTGRTARTATDPPSR